MSCSWLLLPTVPFDAESVAIAVDVAGIGAGKMRRAQKAAMLGAMLQHLAARARRHLLVPAELARPVRVTDLHGMMHDVAAEDRFAAGIGEPDDDRARRVARRVLDGQQRVRLVVGV